MISGIFDALVRAADKQVPANGPRFEAYLKSVIVEVPDFPQHGINFKNITPVLEDPRVFRYAVDNMAGYVRNLGPTKLAGMESCGYPFLGALCYGTGISQVLIRKAGKLPRPTLTREYDIEYGKAKIEMYVDSVGRGDRVVVVDDVLATGGTSRAASELIEELGGHVVGFCFLIELDFLKGRERLNDGPIFSLAHYSQ